MPPYLQGSSASQPSAFRVIVRRANHGGLPRPLRLIQKDEADPNSMVDQMRQVDRRVKVVHLVKLPVEWGRLVPAPQGVGTGPPHKSPHKSPDKSPHK